MTLQKASLLAAMGAAVGLAAVCADWISLFGSWISLFGGMKPSDAPYAPWFVFVVSSVLTINLARGLALLLFFILTYREIKGFPTPTALRAVCLIVTVFCAIGLALGSGSVLALPANRMPVPTPVRFLGMLENALMTYFYLLLFHNPLAALPARKRSWIALTIAITWTASLVVVSVSAVETLLSASPGLPTYEPAPPLAIGPLVGSLFSGVTFILFFFTLYKHPPLAPPHAAPGESGTVPSTT